MDALERERRATASEADAYVLTVPAYRGTLAPLPEARRKAFARHLKTIIDEAFDEPSRPVSEKARLSHPPALLRTAEAACAACSGHCCSKGGDHAYMDDDTIRRVTHGRPELTRRRIAALYLRYLGDESLAGSCVFHGAQGCRLPRTLRADLCNMFYCNPLRRFLRDQPNTQPVQIEARPGTI